MVGAPLRELRGCKLRLRRVQPAPVTESRANPPFKTCQKAAHESLQQKGLRQDARAACRRYRSTFGLPSAEPGRPGQRREETTLFACARAHMFARGEHGPGRTRARSCWLRQTVLWVRGGISAQRREPLYTLQGKSSSHHGGKCQVDNFSRPAAAIDA